MDEQLYDIWYVETENVTYKRGDKVERSLKDKCVAQGITKECAQEFIYFEHADEPSPDRAEYWNYVMVPTGTQPAKYQRR